VVGLVGLVLGWSIRGWAIRNDDPAPSVSWLAVGTAFFVAAVVAGVALLTWRSVQRDHRRLSAQQGVARLVLGKAIARLGAFGVGAYVGIAISNLGVSGEQTSTTIVHALLAALGAASALTAGLLLEHACRVPPEDR
jgi:NO-binding membrane sensor protein with MHYT domain